MKEEARATFPEVDRTRVISAMMNGIQLHAVHHGGDVPLAAHLQAALELMPAESAETYCSLYRHKLVDAVQGREAAPDVREKIKRWFGVPASYPEHDREITWILENGRIDSFTMRAYLGDLLRSKGDIPGAELEYSGALELAQEQGIAVEQ
jgi:hypothetical protein